MTFTPSTVVRLISNVPLSNTYEHQMDFASLADQTAYFEGKTSHQFTNFVYQRETSSIRVPVGYDDLYDCNYVMYNNANYSNKWFYAFVTHKEYKNPNMTEVYFEVDVWQTWQFDVTFLPSFIEREHCTRFDTSGNPIINTVPENLEFGTEYQVVGRSDNFDPNYYYLLTCTTDLVSVLNAGSIPANPPLPTPSKVGGLMTGLSYYVFDDIASIRSLYQYLSNNAQQYLDCFQSWSLLPNDAVDINATYMTKNVAQGVTMWWVSDYGAQIIQGSTITMNKYMGIPSGITESKLYMYPYCYAEMTNYAGDHMEIQLEHITGTDLTIIPWSAMNSECRVAYVVQNYNGNNDLDTAIISTNFPELPTASSGYQEYLARNKSSIITGFVGDAVGGMLGLGSALTGGGGETGAIAGFMEFDKIAESIAKIQDAKRLPNSILTQQGGNNFNASIGKLGFSIKWKMITNEYQTILTNFWETYGYKVHQVKVPNLKTRQSWNYVKTVGAKLTGNVPQTQIAEIAGIFNNGVTLWHTSSVGDYTQANGEV